MRKRKDKNLQLQIKIHWVCITTSAYFGVSGKLLERHPVHFIAMTDLIRKLFDPVRHFINWHTSLITNIRNNSPQIKIS